MLPGAIVGAVLAPLSGRMLDSIGPKTDYDWSCIDYFWLVSVGLAIAPDVFVGVYCCPCLLYDRNRLFV